MLDARIAELGGGGLGWPLGLAKEGLRTPAALPSAQGNWNRGEEAMAPEPAVATILDGVGGGAQACGAGERSQNGARVMEARKTVSGWVGLIIIAMMDFFFDSVYSIRPFPLRPPHPPSFFTHSMLYLLWGPGVGMTRARFTRRAQCPSRGPFFPGRNIPIS